MFTESARSATRNPLIKSAATDPRITAAALVGSAAEGREDQWSDIDLALRLAHEFEPAGVAESWTSSMYQDHAAVDHFDLWSGATLFRVFLLESSLQVDLSFWPSSDFRSNGMAFQLIFGSANEPAAPPVQQNYSVRLGDRAQPAAVDRRRATRSTSPTSGHLPARTAGAEPRQVDRSGIQVNVRRATVSPATHQIPSTIAVVPCCQL